MMHFLDIGANVGQSFDDYLVRHPEYYGCHVWCFEPSPRHLNGLIETAAKYSDRFGITICPFGLSESVGMAGLHEKEDPRGDSLIERFQAGGKWVVDRAASYSVLVNTNTLSNFISTQIPDSDSILVKIDAEGSEYPILRDLLAHSFLLRNVVDILVEWHEVEGEDAEELRVAFQAIGHPIHQWMF